MIGAAAGLRRRTVLFSDAGLRCCLTQRPIPASPNIGFHKRSLVIVLMLL